MEELVLVRVPTDEGIPVLLFGANVGGEGARDVVGPGADDKAADAGAAGLGTVVQEKGVFRHEQGVRRKDHR
ncbi:hypothetical protein GCM10010305_60440 [Streptomyces termitum]|uniref:Uncharacterized protein n=1 Tax=Streptomyces termitum TaxID=67368 RepID=A0A918T9A0_9ACTN|nr:hypothetical protein GCM10010305_60440 [Streptomyces termitum]